MSTIRYDVNGLRIVEYVAIHRIYDVKMSFAQNMPLIITALSVF